MRIFLAVFAVIVLASCQTSQSLDAAIQKNLPAICANGAQLHAAFVIVASTGDLRQKLIDKEAAAWAGLQTVCRDPASFNSSTALVKAAEAYAVVTTAIREAKAARRSQ